MLLSSGSRRRGRGWEGTNVDPEAVGAVVGEAPVLTRQRWRRRAVDAQRKMVTVK
jgi:hypothetical protein